LESHHLKNPMRSAPTPAIRTEFQVFLYAAVGDDKNEIPVSVLSALARQNVDPWAEAAELAQLSRESAIARLASLISLVTTGASARLDPTANATRLLALLPRSADCTIPWYDKPRVDPPRHFAPIIIYLIVGATIIASALLGN
jgi:hypothetical protein